jgi:hypothetical protein
MFRAWFSMYCMRQFQHVFWVCHVFSDVDRCQQQVAWSQWEILCYSLVTGKILQMVLWQKMAEYIQSVTGDTGEIEKEGLQ